MFDEHFLLKSDTAKHLYYKIAKNAPIYDFHCHLSAKEIYEDIPFTNISNIFLGHDHYKWRAMRYAGVSEKYITGDASNWEKFQMWAKTCERLIGSPLYHWNKLELATFFGIKQNLKEKNAKAIYEHCNNKIKEDKLSPILLIKNSNVKLICTTDDPLDSLEYHKLIAKKDIGFEVLPTFRPDKAMNILNKDFVEYLKQLSSVSTVEINSYNNLLIALKNRINYFTTVGCRISDHSLESLTYPSTNLHEVEKIFTKKLNGDVISIEDAEKFKLYTLIQLSKEYDKNNWVMQLHIGAMRNNNETMYNQLGPDSGFDTMNDFEVAPHLANLLNDMNKEQQLPKTILYTLNPKDNIVLSSLPHCFNEDGMVGKIQFGAAWWFNDHKHGITEHLRSLGEQGMLAYFIGMLTDSRSFLSYTRHDYFRRILCNYIGQLVDEDEFEKDDELLKEIIERICYKNIKKYLELEE